MPHNVQLRNRQVRRSAGALKHAPVRLPEVMIDKQLELILLALVANS